MRTGVSYHNEPIRATSVYYNTHAQHYRPALNIANLLRILKGASVNAKGKKRGAEPLSPPTQKRRKNMDGNIAAAPINVMSYPSLFHRRRHTPVGGSPVLQHTLSIQYTTATDEEGYPPNAWCNDDAWKYEEDELVRAIGNCDETVDLGPLALSRSNVAHAVVGISESHCDELKPYLLLLPLDILRSVVSLEQDVQSLVVRASLRLVRHKQDDGVHLPFTLFVDLTVSLLPNFADSVGADDKYGLYDKRLVAAREKIVRYVYFSHVTEDSVTIPYLYSVLGPAPHLPSVEAAEAVQPGGLSPTLLPFQRRSVAWLLTREGREISPSGEIVPRVEPTEYSFWKRVQAGDIVFYFNTLTGEIAPNFEPTPLTYGGILAEEPGLGKTVEIISLILLNPAPPEMNPVERSTYDEEAGLTVKGVKGTLIVTPPALASQWMDELARHAPTLRVMLYQGWSKVTVPINAVQVEEEREKRMKANKKRRGKGPELQVDDIIDWCTYVNDFDVVVATYTDLRNDLNVARPTVKRPRRGTAVYSNVDRPRSPLIMCEWHRVVMDEVQMVGGGKVEEMMSLIPRCSSFAVSGTPARSQVADLIHVLKFLRVDGVVGSPKLWQSLIQDSNAGLFADFMRNYAIRTMKSKLEAELTIPQQTRFLVPIEMGRVERHVYSQALEAVLLELGLDANGVAASSGWDVDAGVLRSCLRRLRGLCTHPQVGQLQNDRVYAKSGALKTMDEVLQAMQDQNWRTVMDDLKSMVQMMIRKAQLKQHNKRNSRNHREALELLIAAENECMNMIKIVEDEVAAHKAKGETLKIGSSKKGSEEPHVNGKGKEREQSVEADSEDGMPRSAATDEHKHKQQALSNRLRESRIVLHRIKFLQGDLYNGLGASFEEEESAAYGFCEVLRRDLLKGTAEEANKGMEQLDADATRQGIDDKTLWIEVPYLEDGGVRSRVIVEDFHDMVEDVLNVQSELLWQWRSRLHNLLTSKLISNDGEADGQEYQRSIDDQGEAETYLQAYTALLSDRRQALVNERTLLAAHDVREKRVRKTQAAMNAAAEEKKANDHGDIELQPEHEVLKQELNEQRRELLEALDGKSVKSVLVDLTSAFNRVTRESDVERPLLKRLISEVRELMADQGRALDKLDADLALFRKAFNQRILYFRQLQEISDTVTQVSWEGMSYGEAVQECENELVALDASLKTNRARQRYMENLQKDRDEGQGQEGDDDCVLCGCEFERGFITGCAHVYCEGCFKAWTEGKKGKVCPVCRVTIDFQNLQRFTVNGEGKTPVKRPTGEAAVQSQRKFEYNQIPQMTFETIQTYRSYGDYGQKIQTLLRHLLYLQDIEPGSKSIVFSAWADSLQILERALNHNGIGCLRIDQGAKGAPAATRFKNDIAIQVLLLHGERENAGLNITCASRVFLLESVVQHGFEIQAIARIDRLGQTRPTEVYCYYAEDTVEKNILDLAARRGLSLYTKENSTGTLNIASLDDKSENQSVDVSSHKRKKDTSLKGDFISKVDDMLAILFPHMYEDVEYLVPESEDVVMGDSESAPQPMQQENAVAGPSRLRN